MAIARAKICIVVKLSCPIKYATTAETAGIIAENMELWSSQDLLLLLYRVQKEREEQSTASAITDFSTSNERYSDFHWGRPQIIKRV